MAEAVATVVLIATDVEENSKSADNLLPAAGVVKESTRALTAVAEEVANQWYKALDDKAMQHKTMEAANSTVQSAEDIYGSCSVLSRSPKDRTAKAKLLAACKGILTSTTMLIQLTDLYEALKLIKFCEMCLTVCACLTDEVKVMSDFNTVAQDVTLGIPEVIKLVVARVNFLEHPEYKRRLEDANNVLRTHTDQFLYATRDALADASNKPAKDRENKLIVDALNEIILVTRLSCRDLMDRLNLAFDPLLRARLKLGDEPPGSRDLPELGDAANRLKDLLKKLLDAVSKGDTKGAAETLLAMKGEAGNVPLPESLTAALRNALANPTKEALQALADEVNKYAARMVEGDDSWKNRKNLEGDLDDAIKRLKDQLAKLKDAANQKKLPEVLKQAQELQRDLVPRMTDLAEKFAKLYEKDPVRLKEIQRQREEFDKAAAALQAAAKAAANDPSKLQDLLDAIERLKRAANGLRGACKTPGNELKDLQKTIGAQSDLLPPLAELGKRAEANTVADIISKHVDRGVALATGKYPSHLVGAAVSPADDPFRKRELEDAVRRALAAAKALRDQTDKSAANPSSGADKKALDNKIDDNKAAFDRLVRAVDISPEETVVDAASSLHDLFDKAGEHAKKGDQPNVIGNNRKIDEMMDVQMPAVQQIADQRGKTDPLAKSRLEGIARQLADTVPRLQRQAETTAATPVTARPAEQAKLDALIKEAKGLENELLDAVVDPEQEWAKERDYMNREIEKLNDAIRRGDKPAAEQAMQNIKDSLARQRVIAKALAAKCTDAKQKKRLLDAALDLQQSIVDMLEAAKDAMQNGTGVGSVAPHVTRVHNAQDALDKAIRDQNTEPPRDHFEQAAHEIAQASRNLVVDASAEGQLFGLAKKIADELAKLSAAARAGDNKSIIIAARNIANLLNEVQKLATEAASKCTDKRLSETLLTHATAARNFATQLKILSAVKAATPSDDPTVKQQIVKCAKQLGQSMVKTINAAEISKLRAKKQ